MSPRLLQIGVTLFLAVVFATIFVNDKTALQRLRAANQAASWDFNWTNQFCCTIHCLDPNSGEEGCNQMLNLCQITTQPPSPDNHCKTTQCFGDLSPEAGAACAAFCQPRNAAMCFDGGTPGGGPGGGPGGNDGSTGSNASSAANSSVNSSTNSSTQSSAQSSAASSAASSTQSSAASSAASSTNSSANSSTNSSTNSSANSSTNSSAASSSGSDGPQPMDFACDPIMWYVCDRGTEHMFPDNALDPSLTTREVKDFLATHDQARFGTCNPQLGRPITYWPVCTNGLTLGVPQNGVSLWLNTHPESTLGYCWGTDITSCPEPGVLCFMGESPVFLDPFFLDEASPDVNVDPPYNVPVTFDTAVTEAIPFTANAVHYHPSGAAGSPVTVAPTDHQVYLLAYDPKTPHMRLDLANMRPPDFRHYTDDAIAVDGGNYDPLEIRYSDVACQELSPIAEPTEVTKAVWRPVDGPSQDNIEGNFLDICQGTRGHSEYHVVVAACHNVFDCNNDQYLQLTSTSKGYTELRRATAAGVADSVMTLGDGYEPALAINAVGEVYALRQASGSQYLDIVELFEGGRVAGSTGLTPGVEAMTFAYDGTLFVLRNDQKLYALRLQSSGPQLVVDFKSFPEVARYQQVDPVGDIAIDDKMQLVYTLRYDPRNRFDPVKTIVFVYDLLSGELTEMGELPPGKYDGLVWRTGGNGPFHIFDIAGGGWRKLEIGNGEPGDMRVSEFGASVATASSGDAAGCPPQPRVTGSSASSVSSSSGGSCHDAYVHLSLDQDGTNGTLTFFDLASGAVQSTRPVQGYFDPALAADSSGKIYSLRRGNFLIGLVLLSSMDLVTLPDGNIIGDTDIPPGRIQAMGFGADGKLYAFAPPTKELYRIDVTNGATTLLGTVKGLPNISNGDIVAGRENGKLLFIGRTTGTSQPSLIQSSLYRIDLARLEAEHLDTRFNETYDGFAFHGGTYYVSDLGKQQFATVAPDSLNIQTIAPATLLRGDSAACPPPVGSSASSSASSSGNPFCGNGQVDAGEQCDDGNAVNDDACTNQCTACSGCGPICGNGTKEGTEECDDGNAIDNDACTNACRRLSASSPSSASSVGSPGSSRSMGSSGSSEGILLTCGDGKVDPGEACDDGNANNADGCTSACRLPRCGDGIKQGQEQCDEGIYNGTGPDSCRSSCKLPICGDKIVDTGEKCDDGNAVDTDGCTAACAFGPLEECVTDADCPTGLQCIDGYCREKCADAMFCASQLCINGMCLDPGTCGNGLREGIEWCDDGNANDSDGCAADCRLSVDRPCKMDGQCVTGICSFGLCAIPANCGDGIVQPPEECDQGRANSNVIPNRCRLSCQRAHFGDGVVDLGENCDDGNEEDGDGCSAEGKNERIAGERTVEQGALGLNLNGGAIGDMLPASLLPPGYGAAPLLGGVIDAQGTNLNNSGPAALAVMASGAAAGLAWIRRRRR